MTYMDDSRPIAKAAWLEAAHAVVAHLFFLPIANIKIGEDGSGRVSYTRRFSYDEVEPWLVASLLGALQNACCLARRQTVVTCGPSRKWPAR
jgi:hypothetical protein